VFAAPEAKFAPVDLDLGQLESRLPYRINDSYLLLAAWTRQADSPTYQYIRQLWKFIQAHRAVYSTQQTVTAGDLNSNVRWNKEDRWWNHTDVVRELAEMGLESVHHRGR
jgi:hypothetical protein